jgi:hypothetical protein
MFLLSFLSKRNAAYLFVCGSLLDGAADLKLQVPIGPALRAFGCGVSPSKERPLMELSIAFCYLIVRELMPMIRR